MSEIIEDIKPIIRSLLLALGRRATELEFRREYYNVEGESFNSILQQTRLTFSEFMRRIPDVCRVYNIGGELLIERVSTKESSHMDQLTIVKKKKKNAAPRFRLGFDYSGEIILDSSDNFMAFFHCRSSGLSVTTNMFSGFSGFRPFAPTGKPVTKSYARPIMAKKPPMPVIPKAIPAASKYPPKPAITKQQYIAQAASRPPPPHLSMAPVKYNNSEDNEKSAPHPVAQPKSMPAPAQPKSTPAPAPLKSMPAPRQQTFKNIPLAPHQLMKPIVYKPPAEEEETKVPEPKPVKVLDFVDLTGDTSDSDSKGWITEDDSDPQSNEIKLGRLSETNPFKIELGLKLNSEAHRIARVTPRVSIDNHSDACGDSKVVKQATKNSSAKENVPVNGCVPSTKRVMNPFRDRCRQQPGLRILENAIDMIQKEKKFEVDLEDYATSPVSIPEPVDLDSKLTLIEVMLQEIISPSQFRFQFNLDELKTLVWDMT